MHDLKFEWDDGKAANNHRKHRITFEEAVTIWNDLFRIEAPDDQHSENEDRVQAIGFSEQSRLLTVTYTKRNETIRIINARRATPKEKARYAHTNFGS